MYQVYVIRNESGRYYIGMSEDVEHRLIQHNSGESKWTKGKGPWALVWTSEAMSITDARRLENFLKNQKGGNGFFEYTSLPRTSGS